MKTAIFIILSTLLAALIIFQQSQIFKTKESLARYENPAIPTSLKPDQFRIIVKTNLHTDHALLINYRIESLGKHFATIQSEGDKNGSTSSHESQTNLHVTEAQFLIDHVKSANVLKVMGKVSGAQGYSVMNVSGDYSLEDELQILPIKMLHHYSDEIQILELDDRTYTLKIKPQLTK